MTESTPAVPPLRPPGRLYGPPVVNLLQYRDLVRNLVAKDIKVRYMGAVLGFIWALVNPLIITVMYLVVFTYIIRVSIPNFALYLVTGMLHWILFSNVVMQSPDLLVSNAGLIKKIYFPRILIPFANLLVNITLWLFAAGAYLLTFALLGGRFSWLQAVYPGYFVLLALFSFGISLVLSILFVHFRDIKHIVEIVIQVLFWSAPIVYMPNLVPAAIMPYFKVNPLVEFTVIFADLLYYNRLPSWHITLAFVGWTAASLGVGLWMFGVWAHRLVEDL